MDNLVEKKCIPCQGGVPPLEGEEVDKYYQQISSAWELNSDKNRLKRSVKFKNFCDPMAMANEIGKMADEQWHHPELSIGYGHLEIEVWTHKIDGLVESDFIFAAKCDHIIESFSSAIDS